MASCNESDNEDDDIRQENKGGIYYNLSSTVNTMTQTGHTVGSGYNLILISDGLPADQIKDGTYARVMEKARDNFFPGAGEILHGLTFQRICCAESVAQPQSQRLTALPARTAC